MTRRVSSPIELGECKNPFSGNSTISVIPFISPHT